MGMTEQLLACTTKEAVVEVLTSGIKKAAGWDVASIEFSGVVMTVMIADSDRSCRSLLRRHLVVDLETGTEVYGRLSHAGLTPVDTTIIRNVIS